jgi:predicted nucleotidyltransferase component of viral defense system
LFADNFFLTGGSALAEFYLQHRYSEDLDFFTGQAEILLPTVQALEEALGRAGIEHEVVRRLATFAELRIVCQDESIKMDIVQDTPYRLYPTVFHEELGLQVDNKIDIACNKLSALFDRAEPKDFVDVYFIHREIMEVPRLLPLAQQKHVGLDEYWLSRAMYQVTRVDFLPRMVKSVTLDELRMFFLDLTEQLLQQAGE